MKRLSSEDIANIYVRHSVRFRGLPADYDDEDIMVAEPSHATIHPLTAQELIQEYDISLVVADKLLAYQSGLLASYRETIAHMVDCSDRYNQVKSYLNNPKFDKAILAQYVENDWEHASATREFNPRKHLRNGLIGVALSYLLFLTLVVIGWSTIAPSSTVDYISFALIAFIWLGFTTLAAVGLPKKYRARKVIYSILTSASSKQTHDSTA